MSDAVVVVLEYHEARKTPARTHHEVEGEVLARYREPRGERTHWREYLLVRRGARILSLRVSNRGRVRTLEVLADRDVEIQYDLSVRELQEDEARRIRRLLFGRSA